MTPKDNILEKILEKELFEKNEENIIALKQHLGNKVDDERMWAFCLGAGVSKSCGLPDWTTLLAMINGKLMSSYNFDDKNQNELLRIMKTSLEQAEKNDYFLNKLKESAEGKNVYVYKGIDPLELAEYIRTLIMEIMQTGDDTELLNQYLSGYIQECYNIEWTDDHKEIKGYDCATMKAIVDVMRQKNIRRAITYNYDDLLEIFLRNNGEEVYTIIPEQRKEFLEEDTYKIYHCHGLVPVGDEISDDFSYLEDLPKRIILTETSYYDEESCNYSLANVLQAYSMNYCNLIYVGFSGADYTFRRIIRGLGKEKRAGHFIFFCIDDIISSVYSGAKEKGITWDDFMDKLYDRKDTEFEYERLLIYQMMISKMIYWQEKGLTVIWSTIKELPDFLRRLI